MLTLPSPGLTGSISYDKSLVIDGVRPKVSSVSSTNSDGTYRLNDNISITVNFNEDVIVDDNSSTKQWTRTLGTSLIDQASDIAIDHLGNIFLTGHTVSGLDGNDHLGKSDAFFAKYSSDGNKQWVKQFGSASTDYGKSLIIDSNNYIYLAGETFGNIDGNNPNNTAVIFLLANMM